MPKNYLYLCKECGKLKERYRNARRCKKCGGELIRAQIDVPCPTCNGTGYLTVIKDCEVVKNAIRKGEPSNETNQRLHGTT